MTKQGEFTIHGEDGHEIADTRSIPAARYAIGILMEEGHDSLSVQRNGREVGVATRQRVPDNIDRFPIRWTRGLLR